MNTRIKNAIIKLAEENPTEEICGFIYHTLSSVEIYPAKNAAPNKSQSFYIDPEDYFACEKMGKVVGIYHSHPFTQSIFSDSDKETANEWILPFYVYSLQDKGFREYLPKEYAIGLEGRPFIWGLYDCFALVRDYYWQKFGIYINDYDRDETFHGSNKSIILDSFKQEGFYRAENMAEIRQHDVLLFNSRQIYPHHFGIYLGNTRVLQHYVNRLSEISILGSNPMMRVCAILRYNDPSKI